MVGGIVFAVAYEVEGSLMVPITIHVLGNMAIFALSLAS
jgi:membrane protease YdiL (CAAX protease family)